LVPQQRGDWGISQDASIDVDDMGTVAEADTMAEDTPSVAVQPVPFNVDRPFFFFIRDHATGLRPGSTVVECPGRRQIARRVRYLLSAF
jgi:serine protease inhibitor